MIKFGFYLQENLLHLHFKPQSIGKMVAVYSSNQTKYINAFCDLNWVKCRVTWRWSMWYIRETESRRYNHYIWCGGNVTRKIEVQLLKICLKYCQS